MLLFCLHEIFFLAIMTLLEVQLHFKNFLVRHTCPLIKIVKRAGPGFIPEVLLTKIKLKFTTTRPIV